MLTFSTQVSTSPKTINLVMIDSSTVFLESLPLSLHRFGFLKVLSRSTSVEEGLSQIRANSPEIVLIDGQLYQSCFRMLSEELSIRLGECRVAIFAQALTDAQLEIAAANKVAGFLSSQDSTSEIAEHLEQIASGRIVISEHLRERISAHEKFGIRVTRRSDLSGLTDRQLEVLTHLAQGLRVKEIADVMDLSTKAVESHKFRIMNRLKIRDRVKLCRWAIREGLIEA